MTVGEALAIAATAVREAAPRLVWVRGEIVGLTRSRAGHLYWTLTDAGARLAVCAIGRDAQRIVVSLNRAQVSLAEGMTVRVGGALDVYRPRGQLQLRASAVDPSVTVGEALLARRHVRARIGDKVDRQKTLRPGPCPLRVAVVAPAGRGSEDFCAILAASPWAWQLQVLEVPSEGTAAPAAIAAAIGRVGGCDLVVVARGGGDAVTAAYDTYEVAAAVCACPAPVVVAVGHHADASVADACAWASRATPTAAGELCVGLLERADAALTAAGSAVADAARARLARADAEVDQLEAAVTAGASTVAGRVALARWRRAARVAAAAALLLALAVVALLVVVASR